MAHDVRDAPFTVSSSLTCSSPRRRNRRRLCEHFVSPITSRFACTPAENGHSPQSVRWVYPSAELRELDAYVKQHVKRMSGERAQVAPFSRGQPCRSLGTRCSSTATGRTTVTGEVIVNHAGSGGSSGKAWYDTLQRGRPCESGSCAPYSTYR